VATIGVRQHHGDHFAVQRGLDAADNALQRRRGWLIGGYPGDPHSRRTLPADASSPVLGLLRSQHAELAARQADLQAEDRLLGLKGHPAGQQHGEGQIPGPRRPGAVAGVGDRGLPGGVCESGLQRLHGVHSGCKGKGKFRVFGSNTFIYSAQRLSSMYTAVIYTPASCVVILALSAFWLPPHMGGEKIMINGLLIIVIAAFLMYFAQLLPVLSNNTPLVGES